MIEQTNFKSPNWAIELKKLTKSFNGYPALRGLDLKIEPGKTVVIFGPNGAGKTTFIKVLATIMNPSSGTVLVDGLDIKSQAENIRRKIGVVSHDTFLYGNLTAYENLAFYRRLYDVPGERIAQVAEMVGMSSRLYDRVNTLSRGTQQRFAIARALLHKPSIMLLDEPETGLDQQAISLLWDALRRDAGGRRTVLLTTHHLEWGLETADLILILSRGKIVYQESRQSLDLARLKEIYQIGTGSTA
jgi:heme ABC exporter ATP-binding subunit CcmA